MTIENLIKAKVETLDGVTVAYQYSDEYDMHLIEVIPSEKLDDEVVYNAIQSVIDDYTDGFPSELVYLVTPGSRVQMKSVTAVYSRQSGFSSNTVGNSLYYRNTEQQPMHRVNLLFDTIKADSNESHKKFHEGSANPQRIVPIFHPADYASAA